MFDRSNPTHVAALKSEVQTDPLGIGYNWTTGDTGLILTLINEKSASYTVQKPKISAALIRSTCTYDAYNGVLADAQEWLRWMTGSGGFEQEDIAVTDDVRLKLAGDPTASDSIWAVAERTEMNAAMLALMDVDGSRAEDLWGFGTNISSQDWIAARDS